ncbi:transcriptional regulator NrdR [Candidatus Gracilibacteria bacterium]|nr:transcriptional regulator NrdR [Candidatus Gracilibacteria bacterium]MCF7819125.1 transcriptional regulator NrdR [Candidatus Gracilibacteria bacterium]
MKCPSCGFEDSKVIDSRVSDSGSSIRRRRECPECGFRFTTFERIGTTNLMIEKKDGVLEPYDREKLEKGILIACGKRPVSLEKIREKLSEMEERWAVEKVIPSKRIGEDVMEMLRDIDEIAYIRFASVYRRFKDMEMFQKEFEKLFKEK